MHNFTKLDLLLAIGQYKTAVAEAVGWLRQKDFSNIILALDRNGFIDDERKIEYTFHGYGCMVVMSGICVDFDFGYNGRTDGFNLWFVYNYYKHSNLYNNKKASYTEIQVLADELIYDQIIVQPLVELEDGTYYSDNLYYLAADWKNPNPSVFKLLCKQIEDVTGDADISA